MQNIEKALFNVFSFIGNDYKLPLGEFIDDEFNLGVQFRNPYNGQTASKIKFSMGTQKELNIWLKDTPEKYPLVWLVYPVGKSYTNDVQSFETYKRIRLVFAINNDVEKSVLMRVHVTKFILESIVSKFTELMRNSQFKKYIYIDKTTVCEEKFHPNYSVNGKESGTVDIWDAITLDCDIHLIPNCIKNNT
jgi:hypothetical protein